MFRKTRNLCSETQEDGFTVTDKHFFETAQYWFLQKYLSAFHCPFCKEIEGEWRKVLDISV